VGSVVSLADVLEFSRCFFRPLFIEFDAVGLAAERLGQALQSRAFSAARIQPAVLSLRGLEMTDDERGDLGRCWVVTRFLHTLQS
jgi:hypothetical protein